MKTSWLRTGMIGRMAVTAVLLGVCCIWQAAHAGLARAQGMAASGAWSSGVTDGKEGTWQLAASKSDDAFSGTLTATGPADFGQGTVFGSMTATGDMRFGIVFNDIEEATFSGEVTGGVVSGTYTTKDGDSGTWTGKLAKPQ